MRDRTPHDLARFWDNGTTTEAADLDPALVQVVSRFKAAVDDVPDPDTTFVSHLWEDLMNVQSTTLASSRPTPWRQDEPTRWARSTRWILPLALPRPRPSARWFPALVSAALLLVLGIAGYTVLDRDRATGPRSAAILAPATPSPEAASIDETLVEVPVPANLLPADTLASVGMAQVTIPVGTAQQSADEASGNPGVLATYILDGTVTVVSDEAMQLIPAGGDRALEDVPAGTEITLGAGETLVTRKSPNEVWTNTGPAEVHLIALEVYGGPAGTSSFPIGVNESGNTGYWNNTGYDYEVGVRLPVEEPMLLRLRRVTVPADTTLPLPADAIVQVARPVGSQSFGDSGEGEIRFFGGDGESVSGFVVTLEYTDGPPASPVAVNSPTP